MNSARFRDRAEAGRLLGERLAGRQDVADAVVLGIPRGGVIVAAEVARALKAPLDVAIAHKLGAPGEPELAIGAVASDGTIVLDPAMLGELDVPAGYVERERAAQVREIERRLAAYRRGRPAVPVSGRCAVLCDDGIATGSTALAALRSLRRQAPRRLLLAVPVAPRPALDRLSLECDEAVALAVPEPFVAVGHFYWEFGQTTDAQVIAELGASRPGRPGRSGSRDFDTPNQA
jgi:predicted phosphoribosyltransferase